MVLFYIGSTIFKLDFMIFLSFSINFFYRSIYRYCFNTNCIKTGIKTMGTRNHNKRSSKKTKKIFTMQNILDYQEKLVQKTDWLKTFFTIVFVGTGFTILYTTIYVFKMPSPFASNVEGITRALSLKCWVAIIAYPFIGYLVWQKNTSRRFLWILSLLMSLMNIGIWWAIQNL